METQTGNKAENFRLLAAGTRVTSSTHCCFQAASPKRPFDPASTASAAGATGTAGARPVFSGRTSNLVFLLSKRPSEVYRGQQRSLRLHSSSDGDLQTSTQDPH